MTLGAAAVGMLLAAGDTEWSDHRLRGEVEGQATTALANGAANGGLGLEFRVGYQLPHGLFPEVTAGLVDWAPGSPEYKTRDLTGGLRFLALERDPLPGIAFAFWVALRGGYGNQVDRAGRTTSESWMGTFATGLSVGITSPHGGLPLLTAGGEVTYTQLGSNGWAALGLSLGMGFLEPP